MSITGRDGATTRIWRRLPGSIWVLGLVSLLMDVSSEMIHALLPVYLVAGLGASVLTVGLIEGIAEATAAITKVFSGALSDRIGRRKEIVALGYGLAALTKPIFPLASSVGWLVAARFIDRVGKGIREAPRDALVADITPPALRGAAFGLRQSLDTAGGFVGPLLAIGFMWVFADHFTAVFWMAVIPAFAAVALILFAVREPVRSVALRKVPNPLRRSELTRLGGLFWWVNAVAATFTLARFSAAFLILRVQGAGLPLTLVPLVLVVLNVASTLSAYPAGAVSDRINRVFILILGLSVLVMADLVLALTAGILPALIGVALWGLHMGLTQGLLATMVADLAPPELRGTAFGMFNFVTGAASLAASLGAGLMWDMVGAGSTFLAGAACALLAIAGSVPLRARLARRQPDAKGAGANPAGHGAAPE